MNKNKTILAWSGGEEYKGPRIPEGLEGAEGDLLWEIEWREGGPLG